MDAREEMKRWIATVVQHAAKEDSSQVKADIDLFLGVSAQLAAVLSSKSEQLARKRAPKRPKPPTLAPAKPLQQPSGWGSSAATPKPELDTQDGKIQPEGKSGIRQGIQKARRAPKSEKQALRRQVYGPKNREVAFQKIAKALAS